MSKKPKLRARGGSFVSRWFTPAWPVSFVRPRETLLIEISVDAHTVFSFIRKCNQHVRRTGNPLEIWLENGKKSWERNARVWEYLWVYPLSACSTRVSKIACTFNCVIVANCTVFSIIFSNRNFGIIDAFGIKLSSQFGRWYYVCNKFSFLYRHVFRLITIIPSLDFFFFYFNLILNTVFLYRIMN